jgi:hypothetical protein
LESENRLEFIELETAYKNFIDILNKFSSKKIKVQELHKKNSKQSALETMTKRQKQSLSPKILIPQEKIIEKMRI